MRRLRAALAAHAGGLPSTFWWLWAGGLVSSLATFVFPFLALYLTARGLPPARTGAVISLFGAGILVAGPIAGALADRVGRRPTLLAALVTSGACAALLAYLTSTAAIAAAVFAFGVATASIKAPVQATIADVVPVADRRRAFGLSYWAENLGIGASLVAGGFLASRGWGIPFLADAATTLAFAALVWRRVPETRPPTAAAPPGGVGPEPGWREVLHDRTFVAFLALAVPFGMVFWQMTAALPIDMARRGFSPARFGTMLSVNTFLIVALQPFAARATGRLRPTTVLAIGAALVGAGFGAYALCVTWSGRALATAVWSLGEIAFMPTAGAFVTALAPPALRGRYAGAFGLAFGAAGFAAPAVGPAVLQALGPATLWAACLAVGLAVAAGQLALGRSAGRARPHERRAAIATDRGPPGTSTLRNV
jgi:MFS family permease